MPLNLLTLPDWRDFNAKIIVFMVICFIITEHHLHIYFSSASPNPQYVWCMKTCAEIIKIINQNQNSVQITFILIGWFVIIGHNASDSELVQSVFRCNTGKSNIKETLKRHILSESQYDGQWRVFASSKWFRWRQFPLIWVSLSLPKHNTAVHFFHPLFLS